MGNYGNFLNWYRATWKDGNAPVNGNLAWSSWILTPLQISDKENNIQASICSYLYLCERCLEGERGREDKKKKKQAEAVLSSIQPPGNQSKCNN